MFSGKRLNPRHAGVVAAVLAPFLLFVLVLLTVDPADLATVGEPRCAAADRAAAALIPPLLQPSDLRATRALERAVRDLSAARSHCSLGFVERALRDYAALARWLDDVAAERQAPAMSDARAD